MFQDKFCPPEQTDCHMIYGVQPYRITATENIHCKRNKQIKKTQWNDQVYKAFKHLKTDKKEPGWIYFSY